MIKRKVKSIYLTLPVWAIAPIANSDHSGLNDAEIIKLNNLEYRLICEHNAIPCFQFPDNIDQEKFFSTENDLDTLGADCVLVKTHFFRY